MYNDRLLKIIEQSDDVEINSFQIFNTKEGEMVLDFLKGMYRYYEPSIAGTSRDSESHFRDGLRTAINDIEFIKNYLSNKHILQELKYGSPSAGTPSNNNTGAINIDFNQYES